MQQQHPTRRTAVDSQAEALNGGGGGACEGGGGGLTPDRDTSGGGFLAAGGGTFGDAFLIGGGGGGRLSAAHHVQESFAYPSKTVGFTADSSLCAHTGHTRPFSTGSLSSLHSPPCQETIVTAVVQRRQTHDAEFYKVHHDWIVS